MANNYLQTSFYFQCGNEAVARTVAAWINGGGYAGVEYPDDLRKLMIEQTGEETFNEDGILEYTIAEAELDNAGDHKNDQLWVHIDEIGDLELLVTILAYAMDRYPEVEDRQGFQWAETCSKPRVNEFGGGACFIVRGEEARWIFTGGWLDELMAPKPAADKPGDLGRWDDADGVTEG